MTHLRKKAFRNESFNKRLSYFKLAPKTCSFEMMSPFLNEARNKDLKSGFIFFVFLSGKKKSRGDIDREDLMIRKMEEKGAIMAIGAD